jgi:hypothetical protein
MREYGNKSFSKSTLEFSYHYNIFIINFWFSYKVLSSVDGIFHSDMIVNCMVLHKL